MLKTFWIGKLFIAATDNQNLKCMKKIKGRINHKATLTQTRHKCIAFSILRTEKGVWHHPCFPMGRMRSNVEHWYILEWVLVNKWTFTGLFLCVYVFSIQFTVDKYSILKFTYDWTWTGEFWCLKQTLCNWGTTTTFLWAHKWCYFYQTM